LNEICFRQNLYRQSKHILCTKTLFQNRAVFRIVWEKFCRAGQPQTILRMRITSWIPKATNTQSQYVISIVFHCKNVCTIVSPYYFPTYIACLVKLYSYIICLKNKPMPHATVCKYIENQFSYFRNVRLSNEKLYFLLKFLNFAIL